MPYRIGDVLGSFTVFRFLGRGACGEVFLVHRDESAFAMKAIPCDAMDSDPSGMRKREAALSEARLLQKLRHPHIVRCEEVALDSEFHVVRLVLEYMDGGDLRELIDERKQKDEGFPPHIPRRVLASVGGALQYVHGAGVLHRDVKPANVLLSKNSMRVKLADFGIAKLAEAATLKAQTVVGTPYYFSPELVSGELYGTASDCWALGVCIFEMAALQRPFEASNQLALVRRICEFAPPALSESIASDIRDVCSGFLEKDPDLRWTLERALAVSPAIAALVMEPDSAVTEVADAAVAAEALALDRTLSPRTPGAWGAAAEARSALSAEVDDPEDLHQALAALQQELSAGAGDEAASLESLGQEVTVRLGALNEHYADLVDGLCHAGLEEDTWTGADVVQSPRSDAGSEAEMGGTLRIAEEMLESASAAGVDTEIAEEHVACVRRMLSVRVVWGGLARFCMLPMRVTFSSLTREVANRFGLPEDQQQLRLSWREGSEESFPLDGQPAWEDCLRRRGLAERPGRIELAVLSGSPPRHARRPKRRVHIVEEVDEIPELLWPSPPQTGDPSLAVAGTQVLGYSSVPPTPLPCEQPTRVASSMSSRARGRGRGTARQAARPQDTGRAWATSTGRDKRVFWAGAAPPSPSNSPAALDQGLGLCLTGFSAVRRA